MTSFARSLPSVWPIEDAAPGEGRVAVAAGEHEVVGGDLVFLRRIERLAVHQDVGDAGADGGLRIDLELQAGDLREAARALLELRHAVLQRRLDIGAGDLHQRGRIAEGQFRQDVAARELGARRILLVRPDAAAIGDGGVAAGRFPDRVGDRGCRSPPPASATWRCGCRARSRWCRSPRRAPSRAPPRSASRRRAPRDPDRCSTNRARGSSAPRRPCGPCPRP